MLITNCATNPATEWEILEQFDGDCPCYSTYSWSAGLPVASHAAASLPGTWTVAVDYTDPGGSTTVGWYQDAMYLRSTPTVILIPGYNEYCPRPDLDSPTTDDQEPSTMGTLQWHLVEELGVSDDRVLCFQYDTRKGVILGAMDLVPFVRWIKRSVGDGPLR